MSAVATRVERVYLLRRQAGLATVVGGAVFFTCDDESNRAMEDVIGHGFTPILEVRARKWRELGEPDSLTLTLTVGSS